MKFLKSTSNLFLLFLACNLNGQIQLFPIISLGQEETKVHIDDLRETIIQDSMANRVFKKYISLPEINNTTSVEVTVGFDVLAFNSSATDTVFLKQAHYNSYSSCQCQSIVLPPQKYISIHCLRRVIKSYFVDASDSTFFWPLIDESSRYIPFSLEYSMQDTGYKSFLYFIMDNVWYLNTNKNKYNIHSIFREDTCPSFKLIVKSFDSDTLSKNTINNGFSKFHLIFQNSSGNRLIIDSVLRHGEKIGGSAYLQPQWAASSEHYFSIEEIAEMKAKDVYIEIYYKQLHGDRMVYRRRVLL